ncbi:unnamed protein product [Rotaria magnacalcarata]|uniref:Mid2 domain-containing protein n=1 Tax=Rotaria magnacalcarata TaxID=392030 RepID=A0A816K7B8_9BILA|nr:unnamed protein product [Rotaria magnacalcarata]
MNKFLYIVTVLLYLLVFCKCQTDDTTGTDGIDTSSASSIETTSGVDAFHSTATVASTYEQTFKSSTDSATNLASTSTTTQSVTNTNEISSTTPFSSSPKKNNLGLILGLSLGLGIPLVLIIGVGILYYCKTKSVKTNRMNNEDF